MFKNNEIKHLKDVFDFYQPTPVAKYLGTNYNRFKRLIESPGGFTLDELFKIAEYFDLDPELIVSVAVNQIPRKKKKR